MIFSLSSLDDKKLKPIQDLEQKLGKPLLAFTSYPADSAELKAEELSQVQQLEKDLGVILVACK
jgi:hypothetical protein